VNRGVVAQQVMQLGARRPRSGTRSRQRQCLWASVRLADPNWWLNY